MEDSLKKNRAWIEIDLSALKHNVEEIRKILPAKTEIMAVVKGNAYGHGIVLVSNYLSTLGIQNFAVATLEEGIKLRESGISGSILILGYTSIESLKKVAEYDFIQTIVDEKYAEKLLNLPFRIKVHIKINTGMNRIGIHYTNIDSIKKIVVSPSLEVLGIFSHLSSSEQYHKKDIEYTHLQINRFNRLLDHLRKLNISFGSVHLQSSYGVMNYPELEYDYARIGMILYGCHSEKEMDLKMSLDLRPVLSLHAKITSVRVIGQGEFVGYDRAYQAKAKRRIASLSIGYADGYPRVLSNKTVVFVNGSYAFIVGRICMDQMMIDVTGIEVKEGDIVTLIGKEEKIRAEYIAYQAGTISNELLSRLGSRLQMISIEDSKL